MQFIVSPVEGWHPPRTTEEEEKKRRRRRSGRRSYKLWTDGGVCVFLYTVYGVCAVSTYTIGINDYFKVSWVAVEDEELLLHTSHQNEVSVSAWTENIKKPDADLT